MILIINSPATKQQIAEMLQTLEVYIKLAVTSNRASWPVGVRCMPTVKPSCLTMAVGRRISGEQIGFRHRNKCCMRRSSTSGRARRTLP